MPGYQPTDAPNDTIAAQCAEESPTSSGMLDGVDLHALLRDLSTPLNVYSAHAIRSRIAELRNALHGLDSAICYAVKANSNLAILALMAEAGLGADIVSAGELRRCVRAGIPAHKIVFSGVGKTADEIEEALAAGVGRFNVESEDELHLLERLAQKCGVQTHASVRINPDVDALTHAKISTGRSENKFGVSIAEAQRWFASNSQRSHVELDGLHVHIGSQILDVTPFGLAFERVAEFWREQVAAGHPITTIDVGGGLGVCYREGHDRPLRACAYAEIIRRTLGDFDGRILLEPGRWLVAEAGVLLTRVIRVKYAAGRRFLVIDAAMNDLARPSLYDAWHDIVPLSAATRPLAEYDIVGPVCETGDTFAIARTLPECVSGDVLMIKGTGAYGASMASTYNSRPLAAEVVLDNGRYAVIRRRQTFDEMIAGETMATDWKTCVV